MGFNVSKASRWGLFTMVIAVLLISTPGGQGSPVYGTTQTGMGGCSPHQFVNKVQECLEPYWSVAALFKNSADGPSNNYDGQIQPHSGVNEEVMAEHLCRQFETALVCLHTALKECPGHTNVKYVQSKLGSDWAVEIRNLCLGQLGLATNRVPRDEMAEVGDLLESSEELVREYFTDIEENMVGDNDNYYDETSDESFGSKRQKIVVVVPSGDDDDVYQEIVVDVRKKVKFRARNRHVARKFQPLDRSPYSVLEKVSEQQPKSAGSMSKAPSSVGTLICTLVICAAIFW